MFERQVQLEILVELSLIGSISDCKMHLAVNVISIVFTDIGDATILTMHQHVASVLL